MELNEGVTEADILGIVLKCLQRTDIYCGEKNVASEGGLTPLMTGVRLRVEFVTEGSILSIVT